MMDWFLITFMCALINASFSLIQPTHADVAVLIKISKFQATQKKGHDPRTPTTSCCDGGSCQSPCLPWFHFCITESALSTKCLAEANATTVSTPAVQYTFNNTVGNTPNPFVFHLRSFGFYHNIHITVSDNQHGKSLILLDYNFAPYVFNVPDKEPHDWGYIHRDDFTIGSRIEFEYKIFKFASTTVAPWNITTQSFKTTDDTCSCLNNGTCIINNGIASCICPEHYTGSMCEYDPCYYKYGRGCPKEASCEQRHAFYYCICPSGYHFDSRHFVCADSNECLASPSSGLCIHGNCSNFPGGYNCSCNTGWSGATCSVNIDECVSSPCRNGGTCEDSNGSLNCHCQPGFTGKLCESNICQPNPCLNKGSCWISQTGYTCSCPPGVSGAHCENDLNECSTNICGGSGVCINTLGSYICVCNSGYTGSQCKADIDECRHSPCMANATCINTIGSYACMCESDTGILNCGHKIKHCSSSPCHYKSTCIDVVGSFICNCSDGFSGRNCDEDINECLTDPCVNNGSCVNSFGSYTCFCASGYSGFKCQIVSAPSLHLTCQNHGSPMVMDGRSVCQCLAGFEGKHCETPISKCKSQPCMNGGSCEDLPNDFNCYCAKGFHGRRCELDADECLNSNSCPGGSICINTPGAYRCECQSYLSGTNCDAGMATTKPSLPTTSSKPNQGHSTVPIPSNACTDVSGFPCQTISGFKLCDDNRIAEKYCQKTCGRCFMNQGKALVGRR